MSCLCCGEGEPQLLGICDYLPSVTAPPVVQCDPGTEIDAVCRGSGLGYRVCASDGASWSRAHCPPGGTGLVQGTDFLVVARDAHAGMSGFDDVVGLRSFGRTNYRHNSDYVTVEDLMRQFPAPTVPESVRRGLVYLKSVEMPHLKYVLLVGKPDPFVRENVRWLGSPTEMPLWYVKVPPGTADLDWPSEEYVATTLPYGYVRGDWPESLGTRFWTPEIFETDLRVGLLPADGSLVCPTGPIAKSFACATDLSVFADKVKKWEDGRDRVLVRSQFDGAACAGQNWGVTERNGFLSGVTLVNHVHDCSNGESGQMGPLAAADGADYLFFAWHGGEFGSSGGYTYDAETAFAGPAFGHSCLTGSPNSSPASLGESQLFRRDGSVAYVGYAAISASPVGDPLDRASVLNRRTIGDAVDGYRIDLTRDFSWRHVAKDMAALVLYGDPAMPIIPEPDVSVRTLASRPTSDGAVSVCAEVWGDPDTSYTMQIAGQPVGTVATDRNGWALAELAVPAGLPGEAVIHAAECDPSAMSCRAAYVNPELSVPMSCGKPQPNDDGSINLTVRLPYRVEQHNLSLETVVVNYVSPDGSRGYPYLDSWDSHRREHVVGAQSLSVAEAGDNHLNFRLDRYAPGDDEVFRGLLVQLRVKDAGLGGPGTLLGQCYVTFNSYFGPEALGLL